MRSRLAGTRIEHRVAGLQVAGVETDKDQLPDKGVGHDLEAQRSQRLGVVGMAEDDLFHVVRIVALDRGNIERAGQVLDHRIEQRLHTLVLERTAAQHREELHPDGRPAQRLAQLGRGGRFALEELVQHLVIVLGDRFNQLHAEGFRLLQQVRRNLFDRRTWRPWSRRATEWRASRSGRSRP